MILPKIKYHRAHKKASLVWTGILTDWELLKAVKADPTCSTAPHSHRSVSLPRLCR